MDLYLRDGAGAGLFAPRVYFLVLVLVMCTAVTVACGRTPQRPLGLLTGEHPCTAAEVGADDARALRSVYLGPSGIRFQCSTLTVPLDHGLLPGPRAPGQLVLQVAMTDNPAPARGVLMWLVGGPGEAGSRMAADIARQFDPAVLRDYRLVLLSGRGTGAGALVCPPLQQAMGSSDLVVPPAHAVTDCARSIGDSRKFYATSDTVEDIDALRGALGVDKLSIDAASYGTYVAERYAIAHPDHVARMVLDSVQPHDGFDYFFNVTVMNRIASVLRMVCDQTHCGTDPVADLARVVAQRHNGPALLDAITGRTSGAPQLTDLPAALHEAAGGQTATLDAIVTAGARDSEASADELSQGLHAATECEDMPGPWRDSSSQVAGRAAATATAVAALDPRTLYPFDAATATGNGVVVTCELWPTTPVAPSLTRALHARLPAVPVLLLAGDEDVETPLALTQHEAALAPDSQLVVVAGAGHITQDTANPPAGRDAVTRFLTADNRR
jgi:pimeloyl-ACP methyl ester carboxylesterase